MISFNPIYKLFSLKIVEYVVAISHKDNSNQQILSDEKYFFSVISIIPLINNTRSSFC